MPAAHGENPDVALAIARATGIVASISTMLETSLIVPHGWPFAKNSPRVTAPTTVATAATSADGPARVSTVEAPEVQATETHATEPGGGDSGTASAEKPASNGTNGAGEAADPQTSSSTDA